MPSQYHYEYDKSVLGVGVGEGGEEERETCLMWVTWTTQFDMGYTVQLQDKCQL